MKKKFVGFLAATAAVVAILAPSVATANTNGKYIATINYVDAGYRETTINVTYAGFTDKLYQGDGDVDTFNDNSWASKTNFNDWIHYATGNWTATLRSYDDTGANMASDSKSFTNP